MLEFTCDCGRKLKVSNDLAGWQTQCPGCQRLVDVPGSVAVPRGPASSAPTASATLPWKGIAIGSASVALIAIIAVIATAGGSKPAVDEDTERTISKLKRQLADRDKEVEEFNAQRGNPGDLAKATDRAAKAESERDRLKGQLEATTRQLDEYRIRMVKAETEARQAIAKESNPPPLIAETPKSEDPPKPVDPPKVEDPSGKSAPPPAKAPPEPVATPDHPKGIKIDGMVSRIIVDDERDRIVALDTKNQGVAVASISKRKVIRTITTGSSPSDIQFTVNPDVAWVGHAAMGNLVKIEVDQGKVYDRINVPAGFNHFVCTRNHIWTFGRGNSGIITIDDKEHTISPMRFGSLAYDRRRDQLIGIALNLGETKMFAFAPDKCGPLLRLIQEIKAVGSSHPRYKELENHSKEFSSRLKTWTPPAECVEWMVQGNRFAMTINKESDQVYMNRSILKRDKMDTVLATFPPERFKIGIEPGILEEVDKFAYEAYLIQSGSPNGKYVATGTHIYNTEKFTVHKELPVPTPDSAFSSDSKTLYIFDLRNKSIIPVDVE
ncbi:MAG TPA: hypothetical protein VFC86_01255 [Planctomycetota bacterium]|nr:hypothetical protein [Planctomycetota bacterium]